MSFSSFSKAVLLLAAIGAAGCGHRSDPAVSPAPPINAEGRPAPTPPPPPDIIRDTNEPLLPENLRNRVGFRNYEFEQEEGRSGLAVTVLSLLVNDNINLEMAARFDDASGEPVVFTHWSRVELLPMGRHQFFAESSDVRIASGTILIRLLTEE